MPTYEQVRAAIVRYQCLSALILTSLFPSFKQGCYDNPKRPVGLQRASPKYRPPAGFKWARIFTETPTPWWELEWLVNIHFRILITLYVVTLIKYGILIMLDFDFMADYRMLDCFLIGRLAFLGRWVGSTKYLIFILIVYLITTRLVLVLLKPEFNLDCYQFILNGQELALENETRSPHINLSSDTEALAGQLSPSGKGNWRRRSHSYYGEKDRSPDVTLEVTKDSEAMDHDSCYFMLNYFDTSSDMFNSNLRPNRTAESWRKQSYYIYILGTLMFAYFICLICAIYIMVGPTILTKVGFRLNYQNCYSWLLEQKRKHGREYPSISPGNQLNMTQLNIRALPTLLPFEDFFEPTLYGICRVSLDLIVNHFYYADFAYNLAANCQNVFHIVFDAYINYKSIRRRLLEIASHLRSLQAAPNRKGRQFGIEADGMAVKERRSIEKSASSSTMIQPIGSQMLLPEKFDPRFAPAERITCPLPGDQHLKHNSPITRANCDLEIVRIQTTLVDHFVMISKYNKNLEFNIIALLFVWLAYSVFICIWFGITGSREVTTEFYIAFSIGFVLMVSLLSAPAFLHSCNAELYRWIAYTMALDTNYVSTKGRWINIIKYYYPAPLYCFSFFRHSKLSWLFCLKLYSWVTTAFLVVGSFVTTFRGDGFKVS